MKIWYLKFPLTLYKESREEIKEISRKNGFKIVDACFGVNEQDVPALTLINSESIEVKENIEIKKRGRKPKDTSLI